MNALKKVGAAIGVVHDPLLQYHFEHDPTKSKGDQPLARRCGHQGLWTVHRAVQTSTKEAVDVFILSIDEVERRCSSVNECLIVLDFIRKGAKVLQRMKHPGVLRVIKPLEEDKSRKRWVFAAEPIICGVDALCKEAAQSTRCPTPSGPSTEDVFFGTAPRTVPVETHRDVDGCIGLGKFVSTLDETDYDIGLCQIASAIDFLQTHANMVHLNVSPSSFAVCEDKHSWKICDFSFAVDVTELTALPPGFCQHFANVRGSGMIVHPLLCPSLNYAEPSFVERNAPSVYSDVWSFAMMMFYCKQCYLKKMPNLKINAANDLRLYAQQVLSLRNEGHVDPTIKTAPATPDFFSMFDDQQQSPTTLGAIKSKSWTDDFDTLLNPSQTFKKFLAESHLNSSAVPTLLAFADMKTLDPQGKKDAFFKMYSLVPNLAPGIILRRVFPPLAHELDHDVRLGRYVAPIVLRALPAILTSASSLSFCGMELLVSLLNLDDDSVREILFDSVDTSLSAVASTVPAVDDALCHFLEGCLLRSTKPELVLRGVKASPLLLRRSPSSGGAVLRRLVTIATAEASQNKQEKVKVCTHEAARVLQEHGTALSVQECETQIVVPLLDSVLRIVISDLNDEAHSALVVKALITTSKFVTSTFTVKALSVLGTVIAHPKTPINVAQQAGKGAHELVDKLLKR